MTAALSESTVEEAALGWSAELGHPGLCSPAIAARDKAPPGCLNNALLPKLLSGELRVKDAERAVTEVVAR